ncbi:hypothetical protein [Dokdonella sp.]|uniref:hypothetical protein n=1 Tax=Dokdonella sp. TaxID=2291710 RepID=UPI0025C27FE3|nr:hypothetical protein [Dokdonella sp.]MBX3690467.1 hypothetical protein [Dokdonella sp.]
MFLIDLVRVAQPRSYAVVTAPPDGIPAYGSVAPPPRARLHDASCTATTTASITSTLAIRDGSHGYARGEQALLELPSAIVPEERIVLIHAAHADTATLRARIVRQFHYGSVLRS